MTIDYTTWELRPLLRELRLAEKESRWPEARAVRLEIRRRKPKVWDLLPGAPQSTYDKTIDEIAAFLKEQVEP